MMSKAITYSLIFILTSSQLFGQIDLAFKYESSDKISETVFANIVLNYPNGQIDNLFSGTLKTIKFQKKDYLNDIGEYILTVYFNGFGPKTDSMIYRFFLDGNEAEIEIKVSNSVDVKTKYKSRKWEETGRTNKGYISVIRYMIPLETVGIRLGINKRVGLTPIFDLINNSSDTLYGEYLPGYFWGQILYQINDSTWSRKIGGRIDLNFKPIGPLYPDSSRIATVGSFGQYKYPTNGFYKYEVLYSKTGDSHGYRKYLTTENLEWWSKTEEFYRLEYKFEIK